MIAVADEAPITGTSGALENRSGSRTCALHHSSGCTRSESSAPNARGNCAKCARQNAEQQKK
jgi:hypothetical protein